MSAGHYLTPEKIAGLLHVAREHDAFTAARWAGVTTQHARLICGRHGVRRRQGDQRGAPSKAELRRRTPRMDCTCPMCTPIRGEWMRARARSLDVVTSPPVEVPVSWRRRAACRDVPQAVFFADARDDPTPAKAICGTCTVRVECLTEAYRHRCEHGVWGGLDEWDRARQQRTG